MIRRARPAEEKPRSSATKVLCLRMKEAEMMSQAGGKMQSAGEGKTCHASDHQA